MHDALRVEPWTSNSPTSSACSRTASSACRAALRFRGAQEIMAEPDGWSRDAVEAVCRSRPDSALPFAEEHGGIGGGPVETMIVMEAFGRALALEPYLATVVLGGGFLRRGAATPRRRDVLPKVAAGERCCSLRACRAAGALRPRRRGDHRAEGRRRLTCSTARRASSLHGDGADKLIVSARLSGEQRDRERHRAVPGRRQGRRACRAAAIRPWTACAPPK